MWNFPVVIFFLRHFLCELFLKSLLNVLQHCFYFMFQFLGHEVCGILAPQPVFEPAHSAMEGEIPAIGPQGWRVGGGSLSCCDDLTYV